MGAHFPLSMELMKRRNNRNDNLFCKENVHKIIRTRIFFILKAVLDVAIPNCKQIPEVSFCHRHANCAAIKSTSHVCVSDVTKLR